MPAFRRIHAREQNVGFARGQNRIPRCHGAQHTLDITTRAIVLHGGCEHLNFEPAGFRIRDRRIENAIEVTKLNLVEIDDDDFAKAKTGELFGHHRARAGYANYAGAQAAQPFCHAARKGDRPFRRRFSRNR
jgi:hypothetical protein